MSQKPLTFPIKRKQKKQIYFPTTNEMMVTNHFEDAWSSPKAKINESIAYPSSFRDSKTQKKKIFFPKKKSMSSRNISTGCLRRPSS